MTWSGQPMSRYSIPTVLEWSAGKLKINADSVATSLSGSYGLDLQSAAGVNADFNTVNGTFRKNGVDVTIPGSQLQSVDNNGTISQATTAEVVAATMTTPVLPAGDYLIEWYAEVKHDTLGEIARVSVEVDGSDIAFNDVPVLGNLTADLPYAGHARRSLTAAAHTIAMKLANLNGVGNASLRRRRLIIRRVS